MSPASKSKSKAKDKPSARAAKEQQNASIKTSGSTSTVGGSPANAYNPISGTFHTIDTSLIASSPPFHDNGRFQSIDDTDEHSSSSHGTVSEYDSVSNNGSCSGESEDAKEKTAHTPRQETIPGADSDRRDKIRLKNEKKHQRQRERRSQELHERCSGYLMSRKLEVLSQQLVAMGFSSERATLALMLNEGRVEQSVSWLLEGSEEARNNDSNLGTEGNLKIDITEELARILAIEVRFKCTKQEVERAVIACEGDLEKVEETLTAQKQEPPATLLKPQENSDTNNLMRPQEKPAAVVTIQQRRNERDVNYKAAATVLTYSEPGIRNLQSPNTNQSMPPMEKRWATAGSSLSVPLTVAPPMQVVAPAKVEVQHGVVGNEGRKYHQGAVREPIIVMQRPHSLHAKQIPISSISASPSVTAGWYANSVPAAENIRSNGKLLLNQGTGGLGLERRSLEQFYHQAPRKEMPFMYGPVDSASVGLGGSRTTMAASSPITVPSEPRGSLSTVGAASPSLAVRSSLGLFAGWGSDGTLGSSTHVDWNSGGLMPDFDYTNIDWTLNSNPLSSKQSGLWLGLSSLLRNSSTGMRTGSMKGTYVMGLQDGGVATETTPSASLHEWTSPFAGNDIFSAPRQFVNSPSPRN